MFSFITNSTWHSIFSHFYRNASIKDGYVEFIGCSFKFDPLCDYAMSMESQVFDIKKAAKMYNWYKKADKYDASIIEYFDEYKKCIDEEHNYFNSNYGLYAYAQGGINHCVETLKENQESRQACFCINSNDTMLSKKEIDKLCTNTIHCLIRDGKLIMTVQMRSSNFLKLLPYDAFMFSVFYFDVYKALVKHGIKLDIGYVVMQISSLHAYVDDIKQLKENSLFTELNKMEINLLIDNEETINNYFNNLLNE